MGGTSITWLWISDREYNPSGSGRRDLVRVPDTLLGPEGTGNRSFETDARELSAHGHFGRGQVERMYCPACRRQHRTRPGTRPYLENCTVDASIFVAKFLRAHGGCLGTRSR